MTVGDLVRPAAPYPEYSPDSVGMVIKVGVKMAYSTKDHCPPGVTILWGDDGKEDVYEDEVEVIDGNE